jgi:hypothetical protein
MADQQHFIDESKQFTVDDPIRTHSDLKRTRESIKELLKHGTPDWVRFPQDYKYLAQEWIAYEKERSDDAVRQFRMPGQEAYSDATPRKINLMGTWDFLQKLRQNGVQCFTFYNGMKGTAGLWAAKPNREEVDYVAYVQIPAMYEWSVLRLDEHHLPMGENFRGWRTVLAQLIVREVLTEEKAHKIFGEPSGEQSVFYRRTLWNFRNGIGRKAPINNEL